VPEHVAVQRIERGVVYIGSQNAFALIIEDNHASDTTQATEGFLVQFCPSLRTGPKHQQTNRLPAVPQSEDEQSCSTILAALRIADHRALAVIDLRLFSGQSLDHGTCFRVLASVQFGDKTPDALVAAGEAAGVHQLLPDRHRVPAT
jgi:hypothetical protein